MSLDTDECRFLFQVDQAAVDKAWLHAPSATVPVPSTISQRSCSPVQLSCPHSPVAHTESSAKVEQKLSSGQFSLAEEEALRRAFRAWIVNGVPSRSGKEIQRVIDKEECLRGRSYRCVYFKLKRMHAAHTKKV